MAYAMTQAMAYAMGTPIGSRDGHSTPLHKYLQITLICGGRGYLDLKFKPKVIARNRLDLNQQHPTPHGGR